MKAIRDLDLGDIVTDGNGNYAHVLKDCNAPYNYYYGNIDEPDESEEVIEVSDFYEDHLGAYPGKRSTNDAIIL